MTPERFFGLAAAYGGSIARWPAGERDEALALLRQDPTLRDGLAAAGALDAALATWTVAGPGAALAAQVAQATARRHARTRRLRLWWSGLGAATALAGGAAAGVLVVMLATPPAPSRSALYELSVLGAPLDPPGAAGADL